jgi:hypothetical protein
MAAVGSHLQPWAAIRGLTNDPGFRFVLMGAQGTPPASNAVRRIIPIRMHRFAAAAAAGLYVASCAGTIKEGMVKFEGLPLSAVISKIGVPADERWVAGKKVYVWGSLAEKLTKGAKQCQIRATMNGDIIWSFDYEGDETLCQQYAARLRP